MNDINGIIARLTSYPNTATVSDAHDLLEALESSIQMHRVQFERANLLEKKLLQRNALLDKLVGSLYGVRNTILQAWSWEAMKNALKPFDEIVSEIHQV